MSNSELMPPSGEWNDGAFAFPIRVYYEDTDVGGMVYHARYVSFFERVRSESIRGSAADVDALFELSEEEGGPLTYVVNKLNITYRAQSKIGDVLIGHCVVTKVRAAAVEIKQWIMRGDDIIAEADLVVAVVGDDGRPRRWSKASKETWQKWHSAAVQAGRV